MRRFRKVRHVPLPLLAVMMAAILFAELARCEREGAKETAAEAEKSVPRRAALTFDDGPNACYTPEVLEILKENDTCIISVIDNGDGMTSTQIEKMNSGIFPNNIVAKLFNHKEEKMFSVNENERDNVKVNLNK